jgi:hypothetical protein
MTKKQKRKGYTTDLTLGWVTEELGHDWLQWQQYAAEWLKRHDTGISEGLESIRKFRVMVISGVREGRKDGVSC